MWKGIAKDFTGETEMTWTTISTIRGDAQRDLTIEVREDADSGEHDLILKQEDDQRVIISRRQMGKLLLILEQQMYKIERGL